MKPILCGVVVVGALLGLPRASLAAVDGRMGPSSVRGQEVCVVENQEVNVDFTVSIENQLKEAGYGGRVVPDAAHCEFVLTYAASWRRSKYGPRLWTARFSLLRNGGEVAWSSFQYAASRLSGEGSVRSIIGLMIARIVPVSQG
jgi:hypothetical protein